MGTDVKSTGFSFGKLWILGVFTHIALFIFVLDLYFKSPVIHGLTPVSKVGTSDPLAKRLVLFIADGLRAETFYYQDPEKYTPYLNSIKNNKSSWGYVHTGVPTESRPGHVAILAGIYEDPSAIMTGWQKNIVQFDSVINRSNYAWSIGSPDIVTIFKKNDNEKLILQYYDESDEDFSGKSSTINLDKYVFEKMNEHLKNNCKNIESDRMSKNCECGTICEEGNIFFLHLLGMDTAGHIHKPNSDLYFENLKYIDGAIKGMVDQFERFFDDEETAYVFTSDHGMTNWGSHGDGSEHETEVPFLLWGKGFKIQNTRININQVDLAPLLASVVDIPIPVNSVGMLPYHVLNGTSEQIAETLLKNVKQFMVQLLLLQNQFANDWLYQMDKKFAKESDILMSRLEGMQTAFFNEREDIINNAHDLLKDIQSAITYLRNYHFYVKLFCIQAGFILWMAYLGISLYDQTDTSLHRISLKIRNTTRIIISVFLTVLYIYFVNLGATVGYFYAAFLVIIILIMVESKLFVTKAVLLYRSQIKLKVLKDIIVFTFLIELLVFGFFKKIMCTAILILMGLWLIKCKSSKKSKSYWFLSCTAMGLSLLIPTSTSFNYYGLISGSFIWILCYIFISYRNVIEYVDAMKLKNRRTKLSISATPLILFVATVLNALLVALSFDAEQGVNLINQAVSWFLSGASIVMIIMTSTGIYVRFSQICGCLVIPITLMSVNVDLIFYSLLTWLLYNWIQIESEMFDKKINVNLMFYPSEMNNETHKTSFSQFRTTFFYLALTICYFFAIGNLASFNGFDPNWTRAFVSTFNPFLMFTLIIFKMIIPFFTIMCAFYAIIIVTKVNATTTFVILLLYLDVMVMNFLLFVRNVGSWKEIGSSLSHFVIMEAMALVMLIFYKFSKHVTTINFTDIKEIKKFDKTSRNVQIKIAID